MLHRCNDREWEWEGMGKALWESHGNGNWLQNWEWEWEGMGIDCTGMGGSGNVKSHSLASLICIHQTVSMQPSYRPCYAPCPAACLSVRLSVCPVRATTLENKKSTKKVRTFPGKCSHQFRLFCAFSVLDLSSSTGQTDRRTDGRTGNTLNTARNSGRQFASIAKHHTHRA